MTSSTQVVSTAADRLDVDERERAARQLRLEARQIAEEAEQAAAELAAATRTMSEALLDEGRLGYPMRLEVAGREWPGLVDHVGDEIVGLELADGSRLEVCLAAIETVAIDDSGPPRPRPVRRGHPVTVVARLRELVQGEHTVEIGITSGSIVHGRLRSASNSHVEVVAHGGRVLVRLDRIAWIRGPSPAAG